MKNNYYPNPNMNKLDAKDFCKAICKIGILTGRPTSGFENLFASNVSRILEHAEGIDEEYVDCNYDHIIVYYRGLEWYFSFNYNRNDNVDVCTVAIQQEDLGIDREVSLIDFLTGDVKF